MNATIIALAGYLLWTLILVVALLGYRSMLVSKNAKAANEFKPDGSDGSPFEVRLNRAYANCLESFAMVGGVMLLALATSAAAVTNPLALVVLAARIGQSITHLISTSVIAVQVRFAFFVIQLGICGYWLVKLLLKFL